MNRYASQLGAKVRRLRAVALVGIAAMISGAVLATPVHAVVDVGPIVATHGFPAWYEDSNSLSVQPCLDVAFCVSPPPHGGAVGVPGNFPDEGAYWSASTRVAAIGAPRLDLVMALEFTFAGGVPAVGDQITFQRFRFRMDTLVPLATYTLTYPFGTRTFVADAKGAINVTEDIGCVHAPCNFADALAGPITSFLMWDPAVGPAAPAGFLGDPALEHTVIGSPNGTNFVRVTGPNAGGLGVNTVVTNLFNVEGQIATANFRAPDAPAHVTATAGPGSGEATVTWTKPVRDGGTKVTGYRVFGGDSATNLAALADVDATTTSFVDRGLAEGATRFYAVAAANTAGTGLTSAPVSVVTYARPSAPVGVVASQGTGLGQTVVTWDVPETDGGTPITSYMISRAQGNGAYSVIATVGGDLRSFQDSGLLPIIFSYHYTVTAVNLVGSGDGSAPACTRAYPWVSSLDGLLPC